jgi:hypothetical protein
MDPFTFLNQPISGNKLSNNRAIVTPSDPVTAREQVAPTQTNSSPHDEEGDQSLLLKASSSEVPRHNT